MFRKILIANRGEIAVRVIRACREMGIPTVAVYSEADGEALHTMLADEAICIGPGPSGESYRNMERILSAALAMGADAIHPGFGFLSENSRFAEICEQYHVRFIGPGSGVIARMGDKSEARRTMTAAGIPVVPGTEAPVLTAAEGLREAERIGYPVMIKASAGGGGKGMRAAEGPDTFEALFLTAQREAEKGFGDPTMYLERCIRNPRHIEFQILADSQGHVIHLGERDCSVQRHHQKVLEESPSPALTEALRREMGETAVRAAKAAGYENAGTVEFLLDSDGSYYFLEMNTRIQVEHPVTEMVTGLDLIREQIRIAAGEPLAYRQEDIALTGHALECRVNAECPEQDFRPCPGKLTHVHFPGGPGVRIDSAAYPGCEVPPFYDSMLAKIIVHGRDRENALVKMEGALAELVLVGVDTNQEYLERILAHPVFREGRQDTSFIEQYF